MPTVEEILRQTGFSDSDIQRLDNRAIVAFSNVLSTAEQERATAELQKRSVNEFWENTYNPGVLQWENERSQIIAEKAKAEKEAAWLRGAAREAGILGDDAPRNAQGQFVAGLPGSTPGSPTFTLQDIDTRLGNGVSNIGWAMQEYQRLSGGQFLPDPFDKLAAEADAQKLPFRDYVARKYDFQGKQAAIQQKKQQEHDDKIRQEVAAERDRVWAERTATGSPVARVVSSRIPELQRQVQDKKVPDPLLMNENQRRAQTAKMIRDTIAERDSA